MDKEPLSKQYPSLYTIVCHQNVSVADVMNHAPLNIGFTCVLRDGRSETRFSGSYGARTVSLAARWRFMLHSFPKKPSHFTLFNPQSVLWQGIKGKGNPKSSPRSRPSPSMRPSPSRPPLSLRCATGGSPSGRRGCLLQRLDGRRHSSSTLGAEPPKSCAVLRRPPPSSDGLRPPPTVGRCPQPTGAAFPDGPGEEVDRRLPRRSAGVLGQPAVWISI
jgi:hypothetical protein